MGTRTQILVRGTVQGVGFRPYVYSLARTRDLRGSVLNNESGVLIDVEGRGSDIDHFIAELKKNPPPLSIIESVTRHDDLGQKSFRNFQILPSETNGRKLLPVSTDISTCYDCVSELFDPNNRRYRYPFINCTNCGPRFTIIEDVPYDRALTTMRDFEMCPSCRAEYENPLDRRFHAEPTACAECGPRLYLCDAEIGRRGDAEKGGNAGREECAGSIDTIKDARQLLAEGKILAVKDIGGYHLVCDALDPDAVMRLRQRKYREDKPFALMAADVAVVRRYCDVSDQEEKLLISRERPIVLLQRKNNTLPTGRDSAFSDIPDAIAPGITTLGFMLPYTPLHYLLLENLDRPLVMTSGNISDEPICYRDEEAGERLHNIADYFLTNNRRIHIRTDDSIVRVMENGKPTKSKIQNPKSKIFLRRSRGYAPAPIKTSFKFAKQILACGAELKNTFCLTKDKYAFLSHHIGDLENLETLRSFTDGIEHFKRLFNLEPEVIAFDLHPEYLSTKYAHSCDRLETKIGVQHHHAHIASCMADNEIEGEVIGVAMDGLGFGTDGKMWGGEFFVADFENAERIAHLDYVPMPGGAKAIREPWRMAAVYVQQAYGDGFLDLDIPFVDELDREKWPTVASMIASKTNCPETSSMGRLFDAISALLCLRSTVNYEGQAAIALEAIANKSTVKSYEFTFDDGGIIKSERLIKRLVEDLIGGVSAADVSARFHAAVANLIVQVATNIRESRNLNRVALSGGVFQNMFLLEMACQLLKQRDFEVLTHSRVPTNDGGISLGQAAVANAQIQSGRI